MPSIDHILSGGLRLQSCTEISGEAGSGKSQLAMHLSVVVQLPESLGGLNKKTLYINTEGPLPQKRIANMAQNIIEKYNLKISVEEILRRIYYMSALDYVNFFFAFFQNKKKKNSI